MEWTCGALSSLQEVAASAEGETRWRRKKPAETRKPAPAGRGFLRHVPATRTGYITREFLYGP